MTQRSPYNDRYKTDQKGKTRKSAAGAKPKREAGKSADAAPSKKAPAKKRTMWGRGPASGPVAPPVQSPEMKKLRSVWWVLWGASLVVAVGILLLQQAHAAAEFVTVGWGLWAAALAGAFYIELGPLRKARIKAIEEAKSGKKPKQDKPAVPKADGPSSPSSDEGDGE